jgi:hypothetical protein
MSDTKNSDSTDTINRSDRINLERIREKTEDDFEKNITYISAGALALSLTFLDKIVPIKGSEYSFLVITSWALLILTLLSNLLSHQYSSYIIDKTIDDVDANSDNKIKNWERRIRKMRIWNIGNSLSLILGITLFVIFVSINISDMSKDSNPPYSRPDIGKTQTGRTPAKPTPSPKITPSDSSKDNSTPPPKK